VTQRQSHPQSAPKQAPPSQQRPEPAPAVKAEDDLTTPSRQVTFASPDRHNKPAENAPVVDERSLIDECFKLVDVDNSGFVTEDELAEFMHSLPKHVSSRAVQQCLADVGGDPEAIDAKTFRLFMTKLAQVTRVAAEDMWRGFRRRKLTQVYEAIGDTAKAEEHEIDREKLKPLLAVLQTGGLRQLGPSALTGVEYAVPYTYAEYEDVMDVLLRVIPAHELINSMRATEAVAEGGQTLAVINRYAGKAPAAVVKQLKDMVGRYGGTSCSNCAAVQAKRDEAEQQMRLIATEKDALADKLKAMTARHKDAEAQAAEAQRALGTKDDEIASLHEQIQQLRQEALEATAAKESLVHKVCEAEAELDLERDAKRKKRAGDDFEYATDSDTDDEGLLDGDEDGEAPDAAAIAANMARRVNMQFLVPAHLGSREEAPIVDRPGALVYSLEGQAAEAALADGFTDDGAAASEYRPMGFATDIYVADADVSEYLALRAPGKTGHRSLAWTIQGGFLSCGWTGRRAPLAVGRWVRVSVKLRWDESCFDVLFDGAPVPELSRVPFRDAAAEAAGVLDIFPRDHVAVYYANMHFFR
jgi:cytochrome c553